MPQTIISVEMDEFKLTTHPNTVLVTTGISTCIAFVIYGAYWDEDESQVHFCGLYHWSGFNSAEKDPQGYTQAVLTRFLTNLRTTLLLEADHPISISNLYFIGGEKEQRNAAGQILVSGTQAEVSALTTTVQKFKFAHHHFTISPKAVGHYHFLTQGNDTIEIKAELQNCTILIEKELPSEPLSQSEEHSAPRSSL